MFYDCGDGWATARPRDRNIKFSSLSRQYSVYRKTHQKILRCFNPDSSSSAHPLYVLDDFIDVGLIDLDLLPGNTQSDGLSLSYIFFSSDKTSWMDECMKQMKGLQRESKMRCGGLISVCVCVFMDRTLQPDVSLWSSLG